MGASVCGMLHRIARGAGTSAILTTQGWIQNQDQSGPAERARLKLKFMGNKKHPPFRDALHVEFFYTNVIRLPIKFMKSSASHPQLLINRVKTDKNRNKCHIMEKYHHPSTLRGTEHHFRTKIGLSSIRVDAGSLSAQAVRLESPIWWSVPGVMSTGRAPARCRANAQ